MKVSDFIAQRVRLPDDSNHTIWPPDVLATYIGDGVRRIYSRRPDRMLIDNGNGTESMTAIQVGTPVADAEVLLPDEMLPALSDYVVYRAFGDESTANHNPERAAQALDAFLRAMAE
jgi:hypothetical protein